MKTLNICLLMIAFSVAAMAAVPRVFNYQGYVSDLDGTALNGDFDLVFRIYDVDSGADPAIWTESHASVTVTAGVFSVLLGSLVDLPPAVLEESELWIGVTVGADTEIAPRLQVTSTPWAYRAAIADSSAVTGAGGGDGGTVINVATGQGLTGGPITTSGTISVADNSITGNMLANNSVIGAKVVDGSLSGADIADGSIRKIDMDDDSVASLEIQDNTITDVDMFNEPGLASIADSGVSGLTTTPFNVTSRSIICPSAGYIVATVNCYGRLDHVTGTASEVTISLSETSGAHDLGNDVVYFLSSAAPNGGYRSSMSTSAVFPVAGPGLKRIYMVADSDFGINNAVFSCNLILMYFPTAYGDVSKADANDDKDRGE